ncbi:TetR/AcrR family transcriptional regulator [Chengkuizengella sp. SCS-71B]|uniref:TetR/AcrR family transcriptional regulator n=1 Tax=Chengkuizengella sp. SCS-71B TaxID=3115290 RepID=UPI0032C21191
MKSTKEKILKESIKLFAKHGYELTTIRMIALNMGINEVTVYRNFGSKEKILEAALSNIITIQSEIGNFYKNEVIFDLEKDILNIIKMILNTNEDNYYFMKFYMRPESFQFIPNRVLDDSFYDYLIKMKEMEKIVDFDLDSLSVIFFSIFQPVFDLKENKIEGDLNLPSRDKYLETVMNLLIRGLAPMGDLH